MEHRFFCDTLLYKENTEKNERSKENPSYSNEFYA